MCTACRGGGGGSCGVNYTSQPDEFVNHENKKEKKKGLSKKAKWGIAGGVLAFGGIVAAAIFSKGKTFKPASFAEHIDFKPAQTMKEAAEFAKKNWGTKFKFNDLDIANFINAQLVKINNVTKGKSVMPKKVVIGNIKSADGLEGFAAWNKGTLTLSESSWLRVANIARANNSSLLEMDKFLANDPKMLKSWQFWKRAIYHEIGHANHFSLCKDARKMHRIAENEAYGVTDHHFTKEFFKDIEKGNNIIKNFHIDYGLSSPCEFVAETFSYLVQGRKIPDEVMKIYKKYGGPMLPNM